MLSVYILLSFFTLQDAALIKFVRFDSNKNFEFENNIVNHGNLQQFNEELLGIRASKTKRNTDIFNRPNALAIVDINGVERVKLQGEEFAFDGDFITDPLFDKMQNVLNKDQLKVLSIDAHGVIDGKSTNLLEMMRKTEIQEETTGDKVMDKQLVALHKLESALGNFEKENNTIQVYRISLEVPTLLSKKENGPLSEKYLEPALENMINVLHNVYGDQLVVEIHTQNGVQVFHAKFNSSENLENARSIYQVSRMTHQDYPAIFLIVSTVVGIFTFALIAVVISFWDNQDMGKNSIIYRLTNNRKKRD